MGEAANHLPSEVCASHAEIAWPEIRGFRNILIHQYFGVDVDVVRDVVENYLPPSAAALGQG
nr:HepT-like ribonuclease domain-containing protein [Gordonia phthalatica]